ncbi:MAG TPA: DUF2007 domain-containing protein [Salinivirgaceae bacterium]|nr:DUF2007 domain-containing protein [Salinivirgaceae bacterium]
MSPKWIAIYSTSNEFEAHIIKQMLASNEIQAILVNKKDSAYTTIGEIEIHVMQDSVLKARTLIKKHIESE